MGWKVSIKESEYDPPRSVSDLAKCPFRLAREHYYMSRNDVEKIASTASLGSLIHRSFSIELERDGVTYTCVKEYEAPRRYGLAARVDYLCHRGDEIVVVELKTARRDFIDEHVRQVRIYMLLLNADRGLVVYVSRTPKPVVLDIVEVQTPMSEDELIELLEKHALVVPIPGSYCGLCPVKDCKYHPQRVRELI